jgi:hypothetical protein
MRFDQLPVDLKTRIQEAKYYNSLEIRIIIDEVLEKSENEDEFQIEFRKRICTLLDESRDAVTDICGY